jgi:hypothetical protein
MMVRALKISSYLIILFLTGVQATAQNYYELKRHPVSTRENDEVAPVMLGNKMVFISNRTVSGVKSESDMQLRPFFKIVQSEELSDGKWKSQEPFSLSLDSHFHDGPVTFNSKGDFIIFSRCFDDRTTNRDVSKFGLFFADLLNGEWTNIREFEFNDHTANTIYPSLSRDATQLYFASDRTGGFGGYDLYVSRLVNGNWSAPENLGPVINTSDDERYPFIHPTGRLYFSSEGHDGRAGGYDIFYSEMYKGKWISPVKMPPPVNSGGNDYTYYVDDKFETGLFTSSRRGTKDIFTFTSTIPSFEVSQKQRENNFCFVFFEENTVELDTTLYLYEWDLGDNTKVRSIQAHHCFAGPGKYKVSLNVIDRLTKEVLFNQAEYDLDVEKIVQAYITCPDNAKANEDIQFGGQESYFRDVKPGEYYWDFGDGMKSIGASVKHIYRVPGTYTVKLGVTEDNPKAKVPQEFCSFKTIVITEN